MSIFKIEIKPGTPAAFDPNPITVVQNDSVFWHNSDPKNAHWPAPSKADPKAWLDYQVPPGSQSSQISFNPGTYTLNYVCAIEGHEEKGTIKVVVTRKKKGAFGSNTQTGAYDSTKK